jgi:hypothetical protein
VEIEEARIFTMLLPTSTVVKSLSKFSAILSTLTAPLSPLSAAFFNRMRFREVNAVSDAEKNALNNIKITIAIIFPVLSPSKIKYPPKINNIATIILYFSHLVKLAFVEIDRMRALGNEIPDS